jgi:tRNA-dihydrouridine synthase B
MIGEAKKLVKIPVLANGDLTSDEDMKRCLEVTGADGVMIGRGALGNPWILSGTSVKLEEKIRVILRHAELQIEHYGEKGIVKLRKVLPWYFKNIPSMKKVKSKLVRVNSVEEIKNILEEIKY